MRPSPRHRGGRPRGASAASPAGGRTRPPGRRGRAGSALVETALVFGWLVLIGAGIVQFALVIHARHVLQGAAQDGARVAAAYDGSLAGGVERTRTLLRAGLGSAADGFAVSPGGDGEVVRIRVEGRYRLFVPWADGGTIPLRAEAVSQKEGFRVRR